MRREFPRQHTGVQVRTIFPQTTQGILTGGALQSLLMVIHYIIMIDHISTAWRHAVEMCAAAQTTQAFADRLAPLCDARWLIRSIELLDHERVLSPRCAH